jgi:chromosome segregation ATPase
MMMNSPIGAAAAARVAEATVAIERAADGVTEQIGVLQAQIAARDAELERLHDVCSDRQRVIDELSGHVSTYRRAAEERAALVASLDFELQRMRDDMLVAERRRAVAVGTADTAVHALDEERQRMRVTSSHRDAELRAAQRETESLRARIAVLDDALTARAALIEELHAACEERLGTIDELSDELAAIRLVAEERLALLETNEAQHRAHEALRNVTAHADDGVDWRAIAHERERALQDVSAEAERRSVLLAELTSALEGRTREAEDLRKRLTRAS